VGDVIPIPSLGDVFEDVRGDHRALRISYHTDRGVVVMSLWAGPVCRGSFRMAAADIDRLQATLDDMRTVAYWAGPVDAGTPDREPAAPPPADPAVATAAEAAADPAASPATDSPEPQVA
jgi:hypothetical protein